MRIDSSGCVLVNKTSTDNSSNKLDVQSSSIRIYSGASTTDTTIHVGNGDVGGGQGAYLTFNASAATPYFSINAISQGVAYRNIALANLGGNVGIGTSSPSTKLHVLTSNPTAANEVARFQGGNNSSNFRNFVSFYTTNPDYWWELSNQDAAGTGSTNGLAFRERSNADPSVMRLFLESGGNVSVGGTASRATTVGSNVFNIFNGTAPVGTLTNGCSFYSTSGEMRVMDAAGNATLLSPHDAETNEWIYDSSHTPTGKRLKIDVERLLRFLNDHFGLDCVHDFIQEN
jgi:hypothetical protein